MINTLRPGSAPGHDAQRGDVLERIQKEYGRPEEKDREPVKKLGKDEFFKIMITQIQHQDPLKPYQNEEMAAQMAQFTALEQMVNVNTNLEKLAQAQQPLHNLGAANLIGKHVTVDSARFLHTEGKYSDLHFDLPADAAKVRVTLINDRGENVREIETTDLKKGPAKITWDGKMANNLGARSGQYMMQINAQTENDRAIPVQTMKTAVVHGVGFEGKETVLLTGDLRTPHKVLLKNVSRVVDGAQASAQGPSIIGAPPGLQIGGLENLIGQTLPQEDKAVVDAINTGAQELSVPNLAAGQSMKYAPVNLPAMRKAAEKPVPEQRLSESDIRRMIAEGPDLSDANPAAAAMRAGGAPPAATGGTENAAVRKSVPSGEDGSTAGQWTE